MIRTKLLASAVILAIVAASVAASAQTHTPVQTPSPRIDTNQDGYIDRSEAAAMPKLAGRFDTLDTDRDGRLSRQELPARKHAQGGHRRMAAGAHARLKKLDSNGDRRISRAEATAGAGKLAQRFDRMDVNADGFVDRADRQQRANQRSDAWFNQADSDNNDQLSRAEYDAAKAKRREGRGERAAEWNGKSRN